MIICVVDVESIVLTKILIKCNGYWLDGKHECAMRFEHLGNWGDEVLKSHESYEEEQVGNHGPFWLGYEQVKIFKIEKEKRI